MLRHLPPRPRRAPAWRRRRSMRLGPEVRAAVVRLNARLAAVARPSIATGRWRSGLCRAGRRIRRVRPATRRPSRFPRPSSSTATLAATCHPSPAGRSSWRLSYVRSRSRLSDAAIRRPSSSMARPTPCSPFFNAVATRPSLTADALDVDLSKPSGFDPGPQHPRSWDNGTPPLPASSRHVYGPRARPLGGTGGVSPRTRTSTARCATAGHRARVPGSRGGVERAATDTPLGRPPLARRLRP